VPFTNVGAQKNRCLISPDNVSFESLRIGYFEAGSGGVFHEIGLSDFNRNKIPVTIASISP
jgi:hypothetical protein